MDNTTATQIPVIVTGTGGKEYINNMHVHSGQKLWLRDDEHYSYYDRPDVAFKLPGITTKRINDNYSAFDFVVTAEIFISMYREIERSNPHVAEALINDVAEEHTAVHLCDSWRGRQQDWGSFYLNLSHDMQYKILRYWGLGQLEGNLYLADVEEDPRKMLFADVPGCILWPHELLKFFYNHGIEKEPAKGIVLLGELPEDKKCYGNSSNWGDYIQSLNAEKREAVLLQIAAYTLL